jgi:hypothetical protein
MAEFSGSPSEKAVPFMETAGHACNKPICLLSHELLNKLSVIVGHCDLVKPSESPEKVCAHVTEIRIAAQSMAKYLQQTQCAVARTDECPLNISGAFI